MESILAMVVALSLISAIGLASYRTMPKAIRQRKELSSDRMYNFSELDQEIADKEKELRALKEVKKKEKRLKDLNEQINAVNNLSQELSISTNDIIKPKTNDSLMSAEEARKLQKITHWSDDDELVLAYEESLRKILKDIDKEINKYLTSNEKKVVITVEDRTSTSSIYPIFDHSKTIGGNAAILEFFEKLINHLTQLGYEVDYQEMCFKDNLIIEW